MPTTAEDTINAQDKAKRLEEEAEILEKARSLTNGHAGDPLLIGEVLLWQVKNSIMHSTLLRQVIEGMGKYQLKEKCEEHHEPKTWSVKVFGEKYALPVTSATIVVGFLVYMFMRKNGWA